jgi:hypothetical protein
VWLWGTYKDSNGHIGIARKRKQGQVPEKSAEPEIVLEDCKQIASGANHTIALNASSASRVFTWGSNGTGQLGLESAAGCGLAEQVVSASEVLPDKLKAREGGGTELDGQRLVRIRGASGAEKDATKMVPAQVQQALGSGASAIVLEVAEREVPKPEKQRLLSPQEVYLKEIDGDVTSVFASAECSFLTSSSGATFGCGLNGDGQVGL